MYSNISNSIYQFKYYTKNFKFALKIGKENEEITRMKENFVKSIKNPCKKSITCMDRLLLWHIITQIDLMKKAEIRFSIFIIVIQQST